MQYCRAVLYLNLRVRLPETQALWLGSTSGIRIKGGCKSMRLATALETPFITVQWHLEQPDKECCIQRQLTLLHSKVLSGCCFVFFLYVFAVSLLLCVIFYNVHNFETLILELRILMREIGDLGGIFISADQYGEVYSDSYSALKKNNSVKCCSTAMQVQ